MARRRSFYVLWHEDHPDTDYAHPLAFTVVLAVSIDVARAAMSELVGPDGWEIQTDPPSSADPSSVGRGARTPASLFPLGCQSVLAVVEESAALFVREPSGRFVEQTTPQLVTT